MVSTHTGTTILTGFDGTRFRILESSEGVYPDWSQPQGRATFSIPGSNRVVVQHMGAGLATITFRVHLDTMAAYRELCGKQGATGVLTLLAGYTRAVGSAPYHLAGRDYEDLDGVELVSVDDVAIAVGHEYVEASVTFARAMNPLTGRAV